MQDYCKRLYIFEELDLEGICLLMMSSRLAMACKDLLKLSYDLCTGSLPLDCHRGRRYHHWPAGPIVLLG